jgi:hypothetical protein
MSAADSPAHQVAALLLTGRAGELILCGLDREIGAEAGVVSTLGYRATVQRGDTGRQRRTAEGTTPMEAVRNAWKEFHP